MGYSLTTAPENVLPACSHVGPKTHTPLLRVKERGLRSYSPGLGRWVNRDPIGEEVILRRLLVGRSLNERTTLRRTAMITRSYTYVDNQASDHVDALGLMERRVGPIADPYLVPRCSIEMFYGHGTNVLPFARDSLMVQRCGGSSAVSCQSELIRPYLPALIPGAVLTTLEAVFGFTQGGIDPVTQVDGNVLMAQNINAAVAYANQTLCVSCCCKRVRVRTVFIGYSRWPETPIATPLEPWPPTTSTVVNCP